MFNTIVSTGFSLPQIVVSNGTTTGNQFTNPDYILLPDGDFAQSQPGAGIASDITVGNFNFLNGGIPNNAVITGFEIQIVGKRGSQTVPPITIQPYAVDDTSGTEIFYPYTTPYTGLTLTNTSHILGTQNYVFATSWTADQANNFKLQLISNGDVYIDTVLVNVYYYIPAPTPLPTPTPSGCIDCDSPIQVQAMSLELPFLANETKFYLKKGSFSYADGTPVQPGDIGTCGGSIQFVFDQGKRRIAGGNFAENVNFDTTTGVWTVLPSGVIEVDIFAVTNRGRQFHTPYAHDVNLMSNHDANSEVIISNSGLFYSRFVRNCQVDIVFSPPIATLKDDVLIEPATHAYNFIGGGVSVVPNGTDPQQMDVTIPGAGGTIPPLLVATGSGTSGNVQVLTLQYDVESSGTDRGALVQISTEEAVTVVSVDIGGTPAVQLVSDTDVLNNIRQEQWGCPAQPVGTLTVTVTLSAPAYISSGVETFANVDQVTPFGAVSNATGASNTPSVVLPTTVDYSLVVDGLATAMTPILYTPGAGQISNWSETANTDTRQGGSSVESAGTAVDNVTMDYSITQNTDWVITAVEVIGITTPASGVQSVTGTYIDNTDPVNPVSIVPLNNTDVVAPGINDDSSLGYAIDSKWFDSVTGILYTCEDATIGAAVWTAINPAIPPATDELVGVSATDTNPDFLQPKLNVHSSDGSVTVTETITNPGANEILDIDLTAAGSGSAGIYTVNADENVSTWFTYTVPTIGVPQGASSINGIPVGWQSDGGVYFWISNTGGITSNAGGCVQLNESGATGRIYTIFAGTGVDSIYQFASGKGFRIKFRAKEWGTGIGVFTSVGFVTTVVDIESNQTSITESIRFCTVGDGVSNSAYGVVADGVANSNTLLASWNNANWNTVEIVFAGALVEFWVNGILDASIATNIPTSVTSVKLAMGTSGNTGSPIISSQFIISQEQ